MNALRRCRNNIDFIDLDTYNFSNVIILDDLTVTTEISRPKKTYIYIDDDESPVNHHERNYKNGVFSSRRYDPDISPVKLSMGKRTYSGRGFSSQSDDGSPDCEFMEDFPGKLQEEWEKASLKRKSGVQSNHGDNDFGLNKNNQKNGQVPNFKPTRDEKKGESSFWNDEDNLSDFDVRDNERRVCVDEIMVENDEQIPSTSSKEDNEKNDVENDDIIVENSIIDQREKLKETEEFKRALEEELLARQTTLKIQAEEAQQLRRMQKRKKAESLRLLDMERRQKQRVEEIRETQKKDEENMNLKEKYRTEVRQELKKLEITCLDMASLLHSLGIQIGNGVVPSSHEVRAAYKRALLSFHPDRSSGSDMREQVEAEEKFKLISRMKDKLSL